MNRSSVQSLLLLTVAFGVTQAEAQQLAIGPNQEITWEQGPAEALEGERPPNIVSILANDLGWNDLAFGGGVTADTVTQRNPRHLLAIAGSLFVIVVRLLMCLIVPHHVPT